MTTQAIIFAATFALTLSLAANWTLWHALRRTQDAVADFQDVYDHFEAVIRETPLRDPKTGRYERPVHYATLMADTAPIHLS